MATLAVLVEIRPSATGCSLVAAARVLVALKAPER
jgi:hypothetical protein